jgi:hypothetical protein
MQRAKEAAAAAADDDIEDDDEVDAEQIIRGTQRQSQTESDDSDSS